MAEVTCSRCFTVFEGEDGSPGGAPLCPACARRSPAPARLSTGGKAGPRAARRRAPVRWGRILALTAVVGAAAGGGGAALWYLARRPAPPARLPPTLVDEQVRAWVDAGLLPAAQAPDPGGAGVRLEAGARALAADLPARTAEALRAYREAIALAPRRAEAAVAGYATAFAEAAGDDADGAELRVTHQMVRGALAAGARPDLLAAFARLLLLVPSPANDAEAVRVATTAVTAAPADPGARLALGLALLRGDPGAAARVLEEAAAAAPDDRRLLSAAARARWASGDAPAALALAARRLAQDPGHAGALALRAEILAASDRLADAREALQRWAAADPGAAQPHLLLAVLAYQRDDDLAVARRHLDAALSRKPDDFTAARALAHRAAVELAAGDAAAAEAAVSEALRRVPGSGPARYQAAVLAFRRGDAAGLRQSAGVLGDRAGAVRAKLLAARSAELSGTDDEAQQAYLAVVQLAPRDPALALSVAGALGRLRASGPALDAARRALARDVAEGRLHRPPTDYWEGPAALVEASRRLEAIGRTEPRAAAVAYGGAAACEVLLGRTVAAERLVKLAAYASPQAVAPQALFAQIALDRGDPRRGLARVDAALEARPGNAVLLAIRGRALEGLGRNADAEQALRLAVEAGPDLLTPRLALARLLARRGEAAEARSLLVPMLRDDPDLAEARGTLLAVAAPVAAAAAPKPAAP
jgi:tetratricopeptide (TPR) repeat protein